MGSERNASIIASPTVTKRLLAARLRIEQTKAETILWQSLKANRVDGFHFRRQQPILGFIVDFYCHKVRLIVEVDGDVHACSVLRDKERDDVLQSHGYTIIRFQNAQVHANKKVVVSTIAKVLKDLSVSLCEPPSRRREGLGGL